MRVGSYIAASGNRRIEILVEFSGGYYRPETVFFNPE
jgi:hypothetical protein